jgi:UDP-N-acetylglucosamine pyrophosphorylase
MTSPATHDKLSSILKRHAYFGLQQSQVVLFKCSTAPPSFAGDPLRALMLGAGTLSRGPPGSGEVFAALKSR